MRVLAEFIMRGRSQAALVAVAGNLVPLISPAAVALVGLRRTAHDGLLVLMWAVLPSIGLLVLSDVDPVLLTASILAAVAVLISAQALKASGAWAVALPVLVASSALGAVLAGQMAPEAMMSFTEQLNEMLVGSEGGATVAITPVFLTGLIGYVIALHVLGSLLLARWWQALLYNPGGLRQELHGLRLPKLLGGALAVASLMTLMSGTDYVLWSSLLALPLVVSGVALVHYTVASMSLGSFWLAIFYGALVLVGPMAVLVSGLGLLDSFMNLRARLPNRGSGGV